MQISPDCFNIGGNLHRDGLGCWSDGDLQNVGKIYQMTRSEGSHEKFVYLLYCEKTKQYFGINNEAKKVDIVRR